MVLIKLFLIILFIIKKTFEDCIIIKDNHGPLMTIGITKQEVRLDNDTNLINFDGQIAAVIHQYDKIPERLEKINKKFDDTNLNITAILNENEKNEKETNLLKNQNKSINNKISIIIIITINAFLLIGFFHFIFKKRSFPKDEKNFKTKKIKKIKRKKKRFKTSDYIEALKLKEGNTEDKRL